MAGTPPVVSQKLTQKLIGTVKGCMFSSQYINN